HNERVQQLKELASFIPTTRYDYSGKPIFDPNRRKIRMPRFKPGALEEHLYRAHPEIALIQRRLWNIWEYAIVWRYDVGISEALPQYYHLDDIAYAFDVVIAREFDPSFLLPDFRRPVSWQDLQSLFRSGASNGRFEMRMGLAYIARVRR